LFLLTANIIIKTYTYVERLNIDDKTLMLQKVLTF